MNTVFLLYVAYGSGPGEFDVMGVFSTPDRAKEYAATDHGVTGPWEKGRYYEWETDDGPDSAWIDREDVDPRPETT